MHSLKSCFRFLSYKILKATLLINISAPTEIFFYTYRTLQYLNVKFLSYSFIIS
uniref:Uncharacterized protein n=1 Tax=Siphoviridae sp. ctGkF12 TaxID=2826224 RepID=A0A8S5M8D2_9CAUD|nr:MAG TPA: hypothetical protein [Siphoviridae sp. ctGkF12]DAX27759.1 MAG TPA: hypothetical protein [Caudoviricetes sp.]